MTKKILSVLLALALVVGLLPSLTVGAKAADAVDYSLYIYDDKVQESKNSTVPELSGLYYEDGVWVMENFSFTTSANSAVLLFGDTTLELRGENRITMQNITKMTMLECTSVALTCQGALTIRGSGSLTVTTSEFTSTSKTTASIGVSVNDGHLTLQDSARVNVRLSSFSAGAKAGDAVTAMGIFAPVVDLQDSSALDISVGKVTSASVPGEESGVGGLITYIFCADETAAFRSTVETPSAPAGATFTAGAAFMAGASELPYPSFDTKEEYPLVFAADADGTVPFGNYETTQRSVSPAGQAELGIDFDGYTAFMFPEEFPLYVALNWGTPTATTARLDAENVPASFSLRLGGNSVSGICCTETEDGKAYLLKNTAGEYLALDPVTRQLVKAADEEDATRWYYNGGLYADVSGSRNGNTGFFRVPHYVRYYLAATAYGNAYARLLFAPALAEYETTVSDADAVSLDCTASTSFVGLLKKHTFTFTVNAPETAKVSYDAGLAKGFGTTFTMQYKPAFVNITVTDEGVTTHWLATLTGTGYEMSIIG